MSAAVKTRPIRISFKARTPRRVIREVVGKYRQYIVSPPAGSEEELEKWFETDVAQRTKENMTGGKTLRHLREMCDFTLEEVGKKVGVSAQRVADWEADRRGISKDKAKKLGALFGYPADEFL